MSTLPKRTTRRSTDCAPCRGRPSPQDAVSLEFAPVHTKKRWTIPKLVEHFNKKGRMLLFRWELGSSSSEFL
eukprot:scaffold1904_cov184-Amphora_coffeaeformis.AAC.1